MGLWEEKRIIAKLCGTHRSTHIVRKLRHLVSRELSNCKHALTLMTISKVSRRNGHERICGTECIVR